MRVLLALAFLLAVAPAAFGGLHFCNKTTKTVWVAAAHGSGDCDVEIACDSYRVWGWWTIEPATCKTIITGDISIYDEYLYYAHDAGTGTWSGNDTFCVDPKYKFDYNQGGTDCDPANERKFKLMNTGTYTDYTQNFSP